MEDRLDSDLRDGSPNSFGLDHPRVQRRLTDIDSLTTDQEQSSENNNDAFHFSIPGHNLTNEFYLQEILYMFHPQFSIYKKTGSRGSLWLALMILVLAS